jgi:methyltransferase (TIGR00027 family)
MAQAAAKTGAGPTALVAIEQYFAKNERIIEDDLAYRMLSFGARAFLWLVRVNAVRDWMVRATERDAPGIWSGMMCRKRFIDEKLTDSIKLMDAVVNLGAGFDTRVYRLPALSEIPVWELDQLGNIKLKQTRLRQVFGTIPSHVKLVAINFDREDLGTVLESHGYSMDKRTFSYGKRSLSILRKKGFDQPLIFCLKPRVVVVLLSHMFARTFLMAERCMVGRRSTRGT